ncbi:ABC transporter B family member 9-like isoform X2 [Phoenix dactylifera]|uniref:ABC transporter B family member 9-like isoform X2 n=1 Tax=Phoenix dactylifera TaxID=42345 RepID=A0A8B7BHG4_PHODC|nr:ABC transporter B family member 9-like isoform X2 [Phoenix dactylifera]
MARDGSGERSKGDETVSFFKLLSFADRKDVALMVLGTIGALFNGVAMPIMTIVFGELVDAFGGNNRAMVVEKVSKVVLKFVYLGVAAGVAAFLQVSCWTVSGERQAARIRGLYLKTILRQDIAFFDNETATGEVIGRMSGDTILIQEAIGEKVGKFLQLVATFFGGFIVAFTSGWLLALVLLSGIPPIVIAVAALSMTMAKISSRAQAAYSEAGTVVEQTVGSIRTVVSFTGEKHAIDKYNELIRNAYKSTVQEGIASGLGIGFVLLIVFCMYGLAIWYGSKLIIGHGYVGGSVINVIMSIMTGGIALGQASPSVSAFAAGKAAAYKMFETINRKPEIDASDMSCVVLEDIKGDIDLKDVYFSYPARPDQLIFDGFSLHVPSGTTMALVGESGSGKSTVISLVERFYDPQAGEVLIDGVNLKKLRLGWIRDKIGLVSQEPILFTTTIKENISYGKEGATEEEISRAIELANAAKFIDKMPEGLDTMVGEHGTQLSGGQKQRIAIARAILKNPKILLLDEATSALDAESEKIVQDALVRIMVDRTTIVVAHRLTTVKNADTISVVHRGKLVEQGSHAELIKHPDGAYSQLIRLQETNKEAERASLEDSGRLLSSSDAAKSPFISGSRQFSFKRSISRASSHGGSGRHSFTVSLGLIGSLEFQEDGPLEDELKVKEDDVDKVGKQVSFRRLAYLNKPEIPVLLGGSIAAAGNGVLLPVFGLLISVAIEIFYKPPEKLRKEAVFWTLMFVLLGGISLLIVPVQHFLFGVAGGKLIERIRSLSFERVVHQEISWFDEPQNSSGAIGARLSADASTIRSLVGDSLSLIIQNLATIIAGFMIAMVANWKLALIVLVLIPFLSLQGYAQVKLLQGVSADAKVMYEEASQVANDAVSSIRTVASYCAENRIMDTYEKKCETPLKSGIRRGIISGLGLGFSFFVLYCTYAICFYVGALFVRNGNASFTGVFRVFFALTMAAQGVSQSSALGPDTNKAKDSAASIFAILDRKSKIDSSASEGTLLANVKGQIEFQHVRFNYPTRPHVQIFRDLCLKIPSGKSVALVGESGSGKSTVICLLERFYDPDSGRILVDGVEIQKFNINWLRQQMGLVGQEPVLFNGTIRANIAYGKQGEVPEEEIIAVAEAANAHKFISSLPEGYETNVGERGVQLSGGQKQRIAIARAILKDPRILLLDEATSALDAESERVVQEALDRVMFGRTTVVVAHRLSTIKGADIISVVKNGVIAEKGRHETLMDIPGGAYASLVALHSNSS